MSIKYLQISIWTRILLFFKPSIVYMDHGGKDYSVKQTWKKLNGTMYLVKEEIQDGGSGE